MEFNGDVAEEADSTGSSGPNRTSSERRRNPIIIPGSQNQCLIRSDSEEWVAEVEGR